MATYSSNTTLKMNAAVGGSAAVSGVGTSGVIYTAPATGYAIIQLATGNAGSFTWYANISGRPASGVQTVSAPTQATIYLGPSATLTVTVTAFTTAGNIYFTGVDFVNTP